MKSKISSIFLYIISILLVANTNGFSSNNHVEKSAKNTDLMIVNNKIITLFTKKNVDINSKQHASEKSMHLKNTKKASTSKVLKTNEEFSYKKEILHSTNLTNTDTPYLFNTGLYYGFVIALILLNFFCFLILEEKLFLYYTFALSALTCIFIISDELIISSLTPYFKPLQLTLFAIATAFSAIFAVKYLTLKKDFLRLNQFNLTLFFIASAFTFSSWIISDATLYMVGKTLFFSIIGIYFLVGIGLFNKNNYAKIYVIACAISILFAFDLFILQDFQITFLSTELIHLKMATLIEMLLITFGILYRMKATKEELTLRKTEMKIFINKKTKNNRNTIENLVEDIYLENLIINYDLDGLEIKLLQYISEGKPNSVICRKLKLSESELESLTQEVYEKLEIREKVKEDHRLIDHQPDYIYN